MLSRWLAHCPKTIFSIWSTRCQITIVAAANANQSSVGSTRCRIKASTV
jgi:hypothetical protein